VQYRARLPQPISSHSPAGRPGGKQREVSAPDEQGLACAQCGQGLFRDVEVGIDVGYVVVFVQGIDEI